MNHELDEMWARVRGELARIVDAPTFQIWLDPLEAVALEGGQLVVQVPRQSPEWVAERYGRVIRAAVELALGPACTVEFTAPSEAPAERAPRGPSGRQGARPPRGRGAGGGALTAAEHGGGRAGPASPAQRGARASARQGPLGNPKLTFEQFVIGDCNRLAHAAALTVAEMPAQAYNPLFICGPPGVGKTHLLSAVGNLLAAHNPELVVRCTTGEAFTNDFMSALAEGSGEPFKAHFREVDVLLMDDVQFLQRKARTEEEFFHTFNALHDEGRQIVISSDRAPADLGALEDRLRERFQAGLVADIAPPDPPTRLAILRKRAQHDGVELADEGALHVIAAAISSSVRALEGALVRVVAYSSLTGRQMTAELAREVLAGLYLSSALPGHAPTQVRDVQVAAAKAFGVTVEELCSSSRSARVAGPRQIAMYLARELTDASLPAIGRQFGGRDHSTVLHACKRAAARIEHDAPTRDAVENLRASLCDLLTVPTRAPLDRSS